MESDGCPSGVGSKVVAPEEQVAERVDLGGTIDEAGTWNARSDVGKGDFLIVKAVIFFFS